MTKFYLIALAFTSLFCGAQTINIPDAVFKGRLLAASPNSSIAKVSVNDEEYVTIDTNGDGQIQQSEALAIGWLNIAYFNQINSLTGIEYFTNLVHLISPSHNVTSVNLNTLTHLGGLNLSNNNLSSLQIDQCTELFGLYIDGNNLTTLDLSPFPNLLYLNCADNNIQDLDLSAVPLLQSLTCSDNPYTSIDVSQNPLLS